jgi:hypothetical protein
MSSVPREPTDPAPLAAANFWTQAPLPCLLCGRPPHVVGLFAPRDPQRFGAPPGKVRLIRYHLCRRCCRLPDRLKRVEAKILADLEALAPRRGRGLAAGPGVGQRAPDPPAAG